MMKSYEGTEALERRRKQVQEGNFVGRYDRGQGSRFLVARRHARRRLLRLTGNRVPTASNTVAPLTSS